MENGLPIRYIRYERPLRRELLAYGSWVHGPHVLIRDMALLLLFLFFHWHLAHPVD